MASLPCRQLTIHYLKASRTICPPPKESRRMTQPRLGVLRRAQAPAVGNAQVAREANCCSAAATAGNLLPAESSQRSPE